MSKRSQLGAARVSAVWMIVVIVLFFVSLAFAYIAEQDGASASAALEAARADEKAAEERFATEQLTSVAISERLGFYNKDIVNDRSNLDAADKGLETLREAFSDVDASVKSFGDAVPILVSSYAAKKKRIGDLESELAQAKADLNTMRAKVDEVTTEKDAAIAGLQQQLTDAENAARDAQDNLESQLTQVREDRNAKDSEARDLRGTIEDRERELERQKQAATTRFNALSDKLKFTKDPEAPDGEILAVSKALGLGWINLGSRNRLNPGMQFRVVSGDPNSDVLKGWARVTRLKEDRAEVQFFDVTDPFDPIVPGDIIYNPIYDPSGRRNALLVGRFSGDYNEKELAILLDEIGITVQKSLDLDTDYLIVGAEMFEIDGEPVEDPVQPSELAVYKNAQELGTQIVSIRDLRRYFNK